MEMMPIWLPDGSMTGWLTTTTAVPETGPYGLYITVGSGFAIIRWKCGLSAKSWTSSLDEQVIRPDIGV